MLWKKKNEKARSGSKKQALEKKKKKKQEKNKKNKKEMCDWLKELNEEFQDIKEHNKKGGKCQTIIKT